MPASEHPVDIEDLLVRSAARSPADYRVFFVAATWLGIHHHLVDTRRLGKKLESLDALPSAVAGAMAGVAETVDSSERLAALARRCRPLEGPRALFDRVERDTVLRRFAREEALPVFERWGLWHDEISLKAGAVRPVRWILTHCPELRYRALLGPGLDARVVEHLCGGPDSIAAVSRGAGATYSATHASISRLIGRGMVESVDEEHAVVLSRPVKRWLGTYPGEPLATDRDSRAA